MRIFGRPSTPMLEYQPIKAPELEELELVADPPTLRRLASFLQQVAEEMDAEGARFDHVHLLDAWNAHGTNTPDIVVSRATDAA
jgi:16S rRNA G527 N7-methylase RsmG